MTIQIKKENFEISNREKQIEILKNTLCKDLTSDEFETYLYICKHLNLDPLLKQIYAIKRKDKMTIQTSVDGLRLIAERTGKYSPGREPTYSYTENKELVSATSYVKKMTADGTWHEISATAFYEEYVQKFYNKEKREWFVGDFWESKPHLMLAKCAETLALKRAFPAELSGIYSEEEMQNPLPSQKLEVEQEDISTGKENQTILNDAQCAQIDTLIIGQEERACRIATHFKVKSIYDIQPKDFERVINALSQKKAEKANESTSVA